MNRQLWRILLIGSLFGWLTGCDSSSELSENNAEDEVSEGGGVSPDGGPCDDVESCPGGAFACSDGRCQMWEEAGCDAVGLGAPCSFSSSLNGEEYEGRCTFHGNNGTYFCAPECTNDSCASPDSICHPAQPTGQEGDWKVCMPACTDTYQCLGGTWECNSEGACQVPNEAACVGKKTLDPCSFEGLDGSLYEGICSAPPPTIEGPPYYSETNLCVRVCDPDEQETCDRRVGVCQPAEPEGAGSRPDGKDYAVCVAPVCNGDEDCMGGMFGCEDEVCVLPSFLTCEGKESGESCVRNVAGEERSGVCNQMGMCLPRCTPNPDEPFGVGDCATNPASTLCLSIGESEQGVNYVCVDPTFGQL